ncbi:lysylphosphatidylglycerol synthase transmembrane domain-containing protein [Christiangramia crocea]|uniref:Flippase-like domain-containing protein n=1 Tax=Christiangramia crocea TaxID=2904124 RepID=A0A9X1UU80_9FLAO|nr:lysylphosphatidylglycerol synthase transmembrane domain-containing protein [Gramella crocea]MCG9970432.1 flippase-like domain-containing protein [Gramella crocea]
MREKYRKKLHFFVKLFFSFILIIFLIFSLDLAKISLLKIDVLLPLLISVFLVSMAIAVMSYRWRLLLSKLFEIEVSFSKLFRLYLIASFFNIFLPGAIGGDVVRIRRISKISNIKIKSASLITISERLSGIYGLLLLLSFSLLFMNFPEQMKLSKYFSIWILRLTPVLVLICLPIFKWILDKSINSTSYFFLGKIIGLSLFAQMGDIIIAFLFTQYFGLEVSFSAFLFIMPLVYMATVLPISLGGLGVREGAFSGLLVLYGADISIAIIISLLNYLAKLCIGIVGYFIYLREK